MGLKPSDASNTGEKTAKHAKRKKNVLPVGSETTGDQPTIIPLGEEEEALGKVGGRKRKQSKKKKRKGKRKTKKKRN